MIQVLVQKSNVSPDCECAICGQGFRLVVEKGSAGESVQIATQVRDAIHAQHLQTPTRSAHPEVPFTVPKWAGLPQFSERPRMYVDVQRSSDTTRKTIPAQPQRR